MEYIYLAAPPNGAVSSTLTGTAPDYTMSARPSLIQQTKLPLQRMSPSIQPRNLPCTKQAEEDFIPPPLKRAVRSETWLQRLPTLPPLSINRRKASRQTLVSASDESVDALEKASCNLLFSLTRSNKAESVYNQQWAWYCGYLERRAAAAWGLCIPVLKGNSTDTATDSNRAKQSLYRGLAVIGESLRRDGDVTFASIISRLRREDFINNHATEEDLIQFVHQAIGWLFAMWDPLPASEPACLAVRNSWRSGKRRKPATSMTSLAVLEAQYQNVRRIAARLGHPIPMPSFNGNENIDLRRDPELASIRTAYLSYHNLKELVKMNLVWTNSLFDHLKYDSRSKSLCIFRHPSVCLLSLGVGDEACTAALFDAEWSEKKESEHDKCSIPLGYEDYLREVLGSYQVIFASHRRSRRAIGAMLRSKTMLDQEGGEIDPLLLLLCTTAPDSSEIETVYKDLEMQTAEHDIPLSDVPFLGRRLLHLEHVSRRHTPNSLRRLWLDRRDTTTWFALWAVLIVGAGTLILQFFQLVFQIYQQFN